MFLDRRYTTYIHFYRNEDGEWTRFESITKRPAYDCNQHSYTRRRGGGVEEIAPALGFSRYQPLIRAYIGQGLREDIARLENSQVLLLTESLRKHGVGDEIISAAIADAQLKTA